CAFFFTRLKDEAQVGTGLGLVFSFVWACTLISWNLTSASLSALTSSLRYVPMIASANPIGMLTMPTFWSGNGGWALAGSVSLGPMATSQIVTTVPPTSEATAPQVLNGFQNRV